MKKKIVPLLTLPFLLLVAIPPIVLAQTQLTLPVAPTVPGSYPASSGPGGFVANLYLFALFISGVLAFGAVVYGGIKYLASAGNPSGQSEGRQWIESALLGLLLLVGAYLILDVVNPALINLTLPTLQPLSISALQGGVGGGSGGVGVAGGNNPNAGRCVAPPDGPCSVAQLQNTCLGGGNAQLAADICNEESGASATNEGDTCADGNKVSIGLFQINVSAAHITDANGNVLNCPSAFNHSFTSADVKNPTCAVTNQNLYSQCVAAMQNPAVNIANTCADSNNGNNWQYWTGSCF